MAFDYSEVASLADELLREFGASLTLIHKVPGTADADGDVPLADAIETGVGAVFDYERIQAGAQNADGSLIEYTDKQLLLSPVDASGVAIREPVADMTRVVLGSTRYIVKNVKKVSPNGATVVMYDCNVRA